MNLTKNQLEKYADVLIWGLETARSKPFKPYDSILIRYDLEAIKLAEILNRKLIQKKRNVILRTLSTPTIQKDFFEYSDEKQRKFINKSENIFYQNLNGNIYIGAPTSLTHLKNTDPKKIAEVAKTRKKLQEIMQKNEELGKFGWTLCMLPTDELAKKANLNIQEYSKQIIKACFLNEKDPVKKWNQIYNDSLSIKKWLNSMPIKTIHIQSKNMDLEIELGDKRKFIGISGHNIPSFEIFTSPDWRNTKGIYYANQPSYRSGNLVEKIKLTFEKGKVTKIEAKKGKSFVEKMLTMDKGAGQIGEFSLTDKRFSKINTFMANTLYDENFGGSYGNCHIALGNSYSDTYAGDPKKLTKQMKKALGYNESALHWDLVNTENKLVTAKLKNGKTQKIYENGIFSC